MPEYQKDHTYTLEALLRDPGSNPYNGEIFSRLLRKTASPAELKKFLVAKAERKCDHTFLAGNGQFSEEAEEVVAKYLASEKGRDSEGDVEEDLAFVFRAGVFLRPKRARNRLVRSIAARFSALRLDEQLRILENTLADACASPRNCSGIGSVNHRKEIFLGLMKCLAVRSGSLFVIIRTLDVDPGTFYYRNRTDDRLKLEAVFDLVREIEL